MEFKTYLKNVDDKMSKMNEEELRKWIHNFARQIPATQREGLLLSFSQENNKDHSNEMKKIIEWCSKVEDGDIYFTCSGYEDYSIGYWDPDWIYEYEDTKGIGKYLEYIYDFAEKCVYEKDYKDALYIYQNVSTLVFNALDEDSRDTMELEIEELANEKLVNLDLKKIALLTAYVEYMESSVDKRAENIYGYFSWSMFENISIENILEVGPEEITDFDDFLKNWISLLEKSTNSYATKLLMEAVQFQKGNEGILDVAKKVPNTHPSLFLDALNNLLKQKDYEKLMEEGKLALEIMDKDLKIRGKIAKITSVAAYNLGKTKELEEFLWETFYSDISIVNYLKLYDCIKDSNKFKVKAKNRIESIRQNYDRNAIYKIQGELSCNILRDSEYYTLCFFGQEFSNIYNICKTMNKPLGWSSHYIRIGIPLFLILLYKDNNLNRAIQILINEISIYTGYQVEYDDKDLWDYIKNWKDKIVLDENEEEKYYNYVKNVIDERIIAIVSGTHRKSYDKAALLAATLGEVEESRGEFKAKEKTIGYYDKMFLRHRAFRDELKKFK